MKKVFIFLWIVCLNLSCTKAIQKFAYNTLLPNLVSSKVTDYLDLNTDQQTFLEKKIEQHHLWHRSTQLRVYNKDLVSLKKRIKKGLHSDDLDWLIWRVRKHRNVLVKRILPDTSHLFKLLNLSQINHFENKMNAQHNKWTIELKKPKKVRYERRFERLVDRLDDFTGGLSDQQKAVLGLEFNQIPETMAQWLVYRKGQQKEFLLLLRSKPTALQIQSDLSRRLIDQEKNLPQSYKKHFEQAISNFSAFTLKVDKLLSEQQRLYLTSRIQEYIVLIDELAQNK